MIPDDPDDFIALLRTPQPDREFSSLHTLSLGNPARPLQFPQPRRIALHDPRHLREREVLLEAGGLEIRNVPRLRRTSGDEHVRLWLSSLLPRSHFQPP